MKKSGKSLLPTAMIKHKSQQPAGQTPLLKERTPATVCPDKNSASLLSQQNNRVGGQRVALNRVVTSSVDSSDQSWRRDGGKVLKMRLSRRILVSLGHRLNHEVAAALDSTLSL